MASAAVSDNVSGTHGLEIHCAQDSWGVPQMNIAFAIVSIRLGGLDHGSRVDLAADLTIGVHQSVDIDV